MIKASHSAEFSQPRIILDMKKLLLLPLLLFFCAPFFGQSIDLSEAARTKQGGTYNSFLFELPDVSKGEAEADWKKYMGKFKANPKFDKKAGLWVVNDATMSGLSKNTVDVYARIIEDTNPQKQTSIVVWFDLGGAYVNSQTHPIETDYCRSIMTDYAKKTSQHHAESVTKAEGKQLKDLESALKKLQKDQTEYYKEIEKAKALITEMEEAIKQNEIDQKTRETDIEAQKQTVSDARMNEARFK